MNKVKSTDQVLVFLNEDILEFQHLASKNIFGSNI